MVNWTIVVSVIIGLSLYDSYKAIANFIVSWLRS